MTAAQPDETLLIYIAATSHVVSTAIIVEREEVGNAYKVQRLVYFICDVLNESKTRYPLVQKMLYAILARRVSSAITSSTTRSLKGSRCPRRGSIGLILNFFAIIKPYD